MDSSIYLAFLLVFLPLLFFVTRHSRSSKRLPPGSLGFPLIGQTFQLINALRENRADEWLQERARKYGPISKLSFLGTPTVFLHGQAANKFIYTADQKVLSNKQPTATRLILGERNILEISGQEHKRLRGAIASFLNPDALKQYVFKMDGEIRRHLKEHWHPDKQILVMPLMKTLTFDVICTLLFGIERGPRRAKLVDLFSHVTSGTVAFPINLPFTRFNRGLRATAEARDIVMQLIREKRAGLEQFPDHHPDLITKLLTLRDEADKPLLTDEEIIDNCILLLNAGYDTTSVLLTFLIKLLSENPGVFEAVVNEQEEIARGKAPGERLTWEDLNKMKYTWRTATETMRVYPPIIIFFRQVIKDFEMGGYVIPKGWQVVWSAGITQMDESLYPEPYKYNPSRFENQGAAPPYSFIPFGAGPRMCPGNEFARTETLTMIHYLVTRFKWKLSLKENVFGRVPMPVFNEGLPIQIEIKRPLDDAM